MRRRSGQADDDATDEALLAGIVTSDDRSCLTFVRRYQRRLFGLALGIVGDSGLAEDVAQEAFLRIFRNADMFDSRRGSVSTWALVITRNLAIDALRVRRPTPVNPDDRTFLELISEERPPESSAIAADSLSRLRSALGEIPAEQRRAVLLAAMYGRTAAEIAMAEAIPLGTAKSRIRVGLARLRDAVEAEDLP